MRLIAGKPRRAPSPPANLGVSIVRRGVGNSDAPVSNLRQPPLQGACILSACSLCIKKWIGAFAAASRAALRIICSDEERMIAKTICRVLGLD